MDTGVVRMQLTTKDLQAGDLLLKSFSGSIVNKAIRLGQRGLLNPNIVHAGVMFDNIYQIESQGKGVIAQDMRVQNKGSGYIVYRPRNKILANAASRCAKIFLDCNSNNNTLKYSFTGPMKTRFGVGGKSKSASQMDKIFSDIFSGTGHKMFCSQFVTFTYQFAATQIGMNPNQVLPINDAKASPSVLANKLQNNSAFEEIGYVMPNER